VTTARRGRSAQRWLIGGVVLCLLGAYVHSVLLVFFGVMALMYGSYALGETNGWSAGRMYEQARRDEDTPR
jgi:membrane protein implicated in regulation of membrane protease activity